jgi:hypothetical protein
VIPAHLNELSPSAARATIPAFVYQAGNFLASYNAPLQAKIAEGNGSNYGYALAVVAVANRDRLRDPLQPGAARPASDGPLMAKPLSVSSRASLGFRRLPARGRCLGRRRCTR